jgi:hypothetical protein
VLDDQASVPDKMSKLPPRDKLASYLTGISTEDKPPLERTIRMCGVSPWSLPGVALMHTDNFLFSSCHREPLERNKQWRWEPDRTVQIRVQARGIYGHNYESARGGTVGWGTALQTGRSQVRFPMVSLEFFIYIILPAALWPWGWLRL